MSNILQFIVHVLGCSILWFCVNYKRDKEVKLTSQDMIVLSLLLVFALLLVRS